MMDFMTNEAIIAISAMLASLAFAIGRMEFLVSWVDKMLVERVEKTGNKNVEGDVKNINTSFVIGFIIILAAFVAWIATETMQIKSSIEEHGKIDALVESTEEQVAQLGVRVDDAEGVLEAVVQDVFGDEPDDSGQGIQSCSECEELRGELDSIKKELGSLREGFRGSEGMSDEEKQILEAAWDSVNRRIGQNEWRLQLLEAENEQ